MGMDVYGRAATAEEGEYFRNNVWWWRPLARYCRSIAPAITARCRHWDTNDGDGLDASGATALADALQAEIDAGRCADYAASYEAKIKAMPDETCDLCQGTGTRQPLPIRGAGDPKAGGIPCNGCGGTGAVRPPQTHYPFTEDNVQNFVRFLRASGGFRIC